MKRPPINPRDILIANIAARAAEMPSARLSDIYEQAVAIATCAAPPRFYAGGDDQTAAEDVRRTAWLALGAANRARKAARGGTLRVVGPGGAA